MTYNSINKVKTKDQGGPVWESVKGGMSHISLSQQQETQDHILSH